MLRYADGASSVLDTGIPQHAGSNMGRRAGAATGSWRSAPHQPPGRLGTLRAAPGLRLRSAADLPPDRRDRPTQIRRLFRRQLPFARGRLDRSAAEHTLRPSDVFEEERGLFGRQPARRDEDRDLGPDVRELGFNRPNVERGRGRNSGRVTPAGCGCAACASRSVAFPTNREGRAVLKRKARWRSSISSRSPTPERYRCARCS